MSGEQASRMTYANYLRVEDLLTLQSGPAGHSPAPCNDEQHFIIVHQTFELWFKQILTELEQIHGILSQEKVSESQLPKLVEHLHRVEVIFKATSHSWSVMQTLTPQGFLGFRDRLGTSSGFESWQMRAMESLLGIRAGRVGGMDPMAHMEKLFKENKLSKHAWDYLNDIESRPSIHELLVNWLSRTPINGSLIESENDSEIVRTFVDDHLNSMQEHGSKVIEHMIAIGHGERKPLAERLDSQVNAAKEFLIQDGVVNRSRAGLLYIETYRELPLLSWPRALIEQIVATEQAMILFRSHHARMVERMIGRRMGTGGSSGVDYLDMTTKYRIFKDLWEVRTILLKNSVLPEPQNKPFYGFSSE